MLYSTASWLALDMLLLQSFDRLVSNLGCYSVSSEYNCIHGVTKCNACRKCFGSFHMGPKRYNCEMQAAPYFSSGTSVCAAV